MTEEKINSDNFKPKTDPQDEYQTEIPVNNVPEEASDESENLNPRSENTIKETEIPEESVNKFQEYFSSQVETDNPKMTDILIVFMEMRKVDEELAEIEEVKGDLPDTINSLQNKINSITAELESKKESLELFQNNIQILEKENNSFEEKINKYDEQKYNVKSNKEYDEIVKSIESLFDEVNKNENKIKDTTDKSDILISEIENLETKLTEYSEELEEKQQTLNELNEEYKIEETALHDKRNNLASKIDEENLVFYDRINGMYKGEATAIVRKGNCSGCFNSIPPQRVIEIKAAEKIYTCQSCGRILISEEIINS